MRRAALLLVLPVVALWIYGTVSRPASADAPAVPAKQPPHRSPIDLAVVGSDRVLAANHTSDSVSLVDWKAGKLLVELPCGQKPIAVAASRDGRRGAVSNH